MQNFEVIWSHSRLNKIIENPKEYMLYYRQGIVPKEKKKSLFLGSGVHWGLERNSSDLMGYFFEQYGIEQTEENIANYVKDNIQVMAESMAEAFLLRKQDFIDEILTEEDGTKLEILEEYHELELICEFDSNKYEFKHKFKGIIDLLFLTNKGFILCDYKTSSSVPDWNQYKSQLFDYILLLKKNFPDVPVIKVAIINLQKTGIKLKKNETELEFQERIKNEYVCNQDLIRWHIYMAEEFDEEEVEAYSNNLTEMLDMAKTIDDEQIFYLNHSATQNMYGKSDYWDIFYHTPDAHCLYNIRDTIFDTQEHKIKQLRDCVPIDMLTVEKGENVLNKYWKFKKEIVDFEKKNDTIDKEAIFNYLRKHYITDEFLLKEYWDTFQNEYELASQETEEKA